MPACSLVGGAEAWEDEHSAKVYIFVCSHQKFGEINTTQVTLPRAKIPEILLIHILITGYRKYLLRCHASAAKMIRMDGGGCRD